MNGDSGHIYGVSERKAAAKIRAVLADIKSRGYSTSKPFSIGGVERIMKDYANSNGINIADGDLYMSPTQIAHAIRDSKKRDGVAVSQSDLENFPIMRYKMNLYYDDTVRLEDRVFIYTDFKNKFVIHPFREIKIDRTKTRVVNFVTAKLVTDVNEFNKYKKVR